MNEKATHQFWVYMWVPYLIFLKTKNPQVTMFVFLVHDLDFGMKILEWNDCCLCTSKIT